MVDTVRSRQRQTPAPRGLTTRQLLDAIGPALLQLGHEGVHADDPLNDVVIHAPGAPAHISSNCMVLGIGVITETELHQLISAVEAAGGGVVAVKTAVPRSVNPMGLTIVEVNSNASWMHVATTIREQMLDNARAGVRSDGASSELFSLANSIYSEIGAPVTIEDRSSALIAWSAGQDSSDAARINSILGRAVQQRTLAEQHERGEFKQLLATSDPVFMPALEPDQLPRVAIAIRAGTEVIGYVWAVVNEPLDDKHMGRLKEFAPIIALQLANLRTETNYARQQRIELTTAVLGGSANQVEAGRLHMGSGPVCLMAFAPRLSHDVDRDTAGEAAIASGLSRFANTLEYFLAAVHHRSASVTGTDAVYALVAWPPGWEEKAVAATASLARDFLARTPSTDNYVVTVGGPAETLGTVAKVRAQVDASLRAVRHPAVHGPTVSTVEDTALSVLLLHLADATVSLGLPETTGPLDVLCRYEGPEGMLTATLGAYFDASGLAEVAARSLHIHPNTMRYRLRRIRDISGLDFADADSMLLARLQLRLKTMRRHPDTTSSP